MFFLPIFLLLPLAVVGGGLYLLLRYVRAVEQRNLGPGDGTALRGRVERLEVELERTIAEVERMEEGQRFMQRLLSERTGSAPPATGEFSPNPHQP